MSVASVQSFASPRDLIVASGPDTTKFLHGQLTQNIETLANNTSTWSLLLQPNGRVIALIRLTRVSGDEILIDVEPGIGSRAHAALSRFLIRTKCTLTLLENVPGLRFTSIPPAAPISGLLNLPSAPWPGIQSLAFPAGAALPDSGGDLTGLTAFLIHHGELRHDIDLVENTLPSETGVVDVAVTFGKGCYVGQELVERIDSRGRIVKSFVRLRSESALEAGQELLSADTDDASVLGTVTSAGVFDGVNVGIALLRGGAEHSSIRLANGAVVQVLSLLEAKA